MLSSQLLSRQEGAQYLRISMRTLDRLVRQGRIGYISAGHGCRVLFRERDLVEYLKKNSHKSA